MRFLDRGRRRPEVWGGLLLLMVAILPGCTEGDADAFEGGMPSHPLAVAMLEARPHLDGLDESERAAIDTFIRHPRDSKFVLRQVCGVAGKGLRAAPKDVVADFTLASAEHLYSDFFAPFDQEGLNALSAAMVGRPGLDPITRRHLSKVVKNARNGYRGPLTEAEGIVLFAEAVEPKPIPRERIHPGESDSIEIWTGAAEILRLEGFVQEGPSVELSLKTYRRALEKWPSDPALLSGLVTFYVEYGDRYPTELREAVKVASARDPNNAAYAYLVAAREFRVGNDAAALSILRSVKGRKLCTFYALERARRVVVMLERAGYGKIRARLTAYRSMCPAPVIDLKDLANRGIQRMGEYEAEHRDEDLATVLELSETLGRQLSASPRARHVERVRCQIIATGHARRAEKVSASNYRLGDRLSRQAKEAAERARAIDKGESMCSGRQAWGLLFDLLGEEKFLRYLDHVLFANESEFLIRCSEKKGIHEVLDLAVVEYPFE